ncbi:NUDIX hydrolase [Phyllobacterium bourgognense]|uniref:NUDIX domain-containing protein n=1 Tax=Phyllobacterium bourgognense TaxID=314236 RepID=A0A368Z6Q1_9HYPH|nr:NUDIX hydrolase [Phyllobacterium bourgognense]RCW86144.1 hypothetical protein C7476_102122 [Phyllobacterium bourgognense]
MHDIPEKTVIPLNKAVIRIDSAPLEYGISNETAIAAGWVSATAANPAIFNGPFFMADEAGVADDAFQARYHRTRFATMMHWKADARNVKPWHIFAVGVIVSRDNKLIAGRMAASTSAAGRIYFPAGSFDEEDVSGDFIDIDANMHREVQEETGIKLSGAGRRDDQLFLVTASRSIALFRRHYFDMSGEALLEHIRGHIAAEVDSELDDITAISAAGEMGEATPWTFRTFADWHFRQG